MSEKTCKYRLVKCSDDVPYTKKGMTSDDVMNYVEKFGSMSKGSDPVYGQEIFDDYTAAKKAFTSAKDNSDYCRVSDWPENKLTQVYSIYLQEVEVDEDGDEWAADIIDWYFPPHEGEMEIEWKKLESFQGFDLYQLCKEDVQGRSGYEDGDVVCFPEGDFPELGYEEWVAGSVREMHDFIENDAEFRKEKNAARNPNMDAEVLTVMAKDEDMWVRWEVARNRNTAADTLAVLARDEEADVREAVAQNPNTPAEALAVLAGDKVWGVRMGVAWNPNTPAEALMRLARDMDAEVREGVTRNRNTPTEEKKLSSVQVAPKLKDEPELEC